MIRTIEEMEAALAAKHERRQARYRAWRAKRVRLDYQPRPQAAAVLGRAASHHPELSWSAIVDRLVVAGAQVLDPELQGSGR